MKTKSLVRRGLMQAAVLLFIITAAFSIVAHPQIARSDSFEPLIVIFKITQNPERISPGETFSENFTFTNVGNDVALSVLMSMNMSYPFITVNSSSTLFVGDISPGENLSAVGQIGVDKKALVGFYSIPYEIRYKDSAGGTHLEQGTFGVQVSGKPIEPIVVISKIIQSPEQISPGETFSENFTFSNVGNDTAFSVLMSMNISYPFAPMNMGSTLFVGEIASGENASALGQIAVDKDAPVGIYLIPYEVRYENSTGGIHAEEGTFGVEVFSRPDEPLAVIAEIIQNPSHISSGETFNMTYVFSNVGDDTALSVLMSIGVPYPFVTVNSSSSLFVGDIDPGESVLVYGQMAVDKKASVGVYSIPYEVQYKNSTKGTYIDQGTFGVEIFSKPSFLIQETLVNQSSIEISPGESFTEQFNLRNVGDEELRMVQLSVDIMDPFAIVGTTSNFLAGDIKPGENKSVEMKIAANENALVGVYSFEFRINYQDSTGWTDVQSGSFGVQIVGEPKVFIDSIRVDPFTVLPSTDALMTVKVANVGSDVATDISMRVLGGNKILTSSTAHVAKLDSKQSQSITFPVSVSGDLEAGTYLLNITTSYEDSNNKTYEFSELYEFGIIQGKPFVPYFYLETAGVVAILAFLGYLFYRWEPSSPKVDPKAEASDYGVQDVRRGASLPPTQIKTQNKRKTTSLKTCPNQIKAHE